MIEMTLDTVKQKFADWRELEKAKDKAELQALSKFGAFTMTRARQSIRRSKNSSEPGDPPKSHGQDLLKHGIFFVVEPEVHNVVIGPAKLNKPIPMILEALEHGGQSQILSTREKTKGQLVPLTIEKRSFMQPAFDVEIKKAPELLKDQIRS